MYTTWVWEVAYLKQLSGRKLLGVWAMGAYKKLGPPLLIFATVEASDFKSGTQHEFGLPC